MKKADFAWWIFNRWFEYIDRTRAILHTRYDKINVCSLCADIRITYSMYICMYNCIYCIIYALCLYRQWTLWTEYMDYMECRALQWMWRPYNKCKSNKVFRSKICIVLILACRINWALANILNNSLCNGHIGDI